MSTISLRSQRAMQEAQDQMIVALRDSSECDGLVSQILNTVFSRYVGANDISNASDSNEVNLSSVERIVSIILYVSDINIIQDINLYLYVCLKRIISLFPPICIDHANI